MSKKTHGHFPGNAMCPNTNARNGPFSKTVSKINITLLFARRLIPSSCLCSLLLQLQFLQDLVCHVLVLPRVSSHALELNAVQRQQRNLDNKDLKLEHHAAA